MKCSKTYINQTGLIFVLKVEKQCNTMNNKIKFSWLSLTEPDCFVMPHFNIPTEFHFTFGTKKDENPYCRG